MLKPTNTESGVIFRHITFLYLGFSLITFRSRCVSLPATLALIIFLFICVHTCGYIYVCVGVYNRYDIELPHIHVTSSILL